MLTFAVRQNYDLLNISGESKILGETRIFFNKYYFWNIRKYVNNTFLEDLNFLC